VGGTASPTWITTACQIASSYPKEIWQAVVIQVGDAVPPTDVPGLDTQAGAQRDVLEHEVARIPVQSRRVFGNMGLQRVQPAVGIEIADGDTHAGLFVAVLVHGQAR